MNEKDLPSEDELLARLRAADPAFGVEPTSGFAASVVARAAAEATGLEGDGATLDGAAHDGAALDPQHGPAVVATGASGVVDLAAERERRRPRWSAWLASAAAAAVVGVGAYAAGAGVLAGGGSDGGTLDAAPAAEQASSAVEESAVDSAYPGPIGLDSPVNGGGGDGAAEMQGAESSRYDMSMMPFWGRRVFTTDTLAPATAAGTAVVHGLDPSLATQETALRLAAVFGLEGEARQEYGQWIVGSSDGSGPNAAVSLDGAASFSYSNWQIEPTNGCWSAPYPDGGTDEEVREYERTAQECIDAAADSAPSVDAAVAELTRVLTEVGLDSAQFEISGERYDGASTTQARAYRLVDGQRTDLVVDLSLAADGVTSLWGQLAQITSLGEYPIVSEADAVARLTDPRFGAQNTGWPGVVYDMPVPADAGTAYVEPTAAPAPPQAGVSIDWPVSEIALVSSRLGLAQHYQGDGSVLLVPAYEFTDADGGTWSVIAVADASLATTVG